MAVIGLVGAQWGDEGKGKLIDILAEKADVVVRAQGGNNAGHTVVIGEKTYKLHLIPSGIFYKDKLCLIGAGTVIDPASILSEMDGLKKQGISLANLKIDGRAHVVMPYHLKIDSLSEQALGKDGIGTTKKGIGPCYTDKAKRIGIRIYDLISPSFKSVLQKSLDENNQILTKIYNSTPYKLDELYAQYLKYADLIRPFVSDVSLDVYTAIKQGKEVLFEGAQGTLLDIDFGTYPFVTSSHPTSGGFSAGSGIGPTLIERCIGVIKAYTTRVGEGPFPTQMIGINDKEIGDLITKIGAEFGTTTGRVRRCGWLDLVMLRLAVRVNGLTEIAINKVDVLSGLGEIKVCVGYNLDGKFITEMPGNLSQLGQCEPIYKTLDGWDGDLSKVKKYADLPKQLKEYIDFIEAEAGCKVTMVGVGAKRENNLI
ncbi:MAG: adenylosuccinate synthase, partial [Firmicutes bacterium]|nr:adenylosuccinate synthase [Bacillota bacterium]